MNFRALDNYLDSVLEEKNVPGFGVAVYFRGDLVHLYTGGYADMENDVKVAPDTLFNLYSASKLSTCTATMQLWEAGRFQLDDPVSAYLPEFREMMVEETGENGEKTLRPAAAPITIRHLLSMQAGIANPLSIPAVQKVKEETGGRCPTREIVRAAAKAPLAFEPGTHFRYSFCHDVLGALVEVVSGERFGDYLRTHVFEPLGMTDTGFQVPEEKRSRMAVEYYNYDSRTKTARSAERRYGYDMRLGPDYESGGGGLASTVPDYAKLAQTLCAFGVAPSGERILQKETVQRLRENQLSSAALADFERFGGPSKLGYGYGLGVRTLLDRERNGSRSQNGEFGWDGMLGSYVLIDPEAEIALFYAQHEGGSPWWDWHGEMRNAAYSCLE